MRHTAKYQFLRDTDYVSVAGQSLARVKSTGGVTYVHTDHLGSMTTATTQSNTIEFRESYTPFGETLINSAANDNQSGFTNHIKDKATGLNYMQARYYDPNIGRFLSIDPVDFMQTGDPSMFNRHSYVANDPINDIDPDGRCPGGVCPGSGILLSGGSFEQAQAAETAVAKGYAKGAGIALQVGVSGGIGVGVARGVLAVSAKVSAPVTSKVVQAANTVSANAIGGGVAGSTVEAATQIAQDGSITDGGKVFNKGATGAILLGAASAAGKTVQATANAFKSGGTASATQGAAVGSATTQVLDTAGTASGVEIPVKEHFEVNDR